ncbi:MAG: hypothetical protein C3F11_20735 [Methylocystaceae bacterium]|nr:MAG: hypothetical protein C3F11_20735 [Methylocystaceae bacterium]
MRIDFHDPARSRKRSRFRSIAPRVTISAGGEHRVDTPSTSPFDNFLFLRGLPNPTRTYRPV